MHGKNFWLNLFLICAGVVIGALVADLTAGVPALSWLSFGLDFGTEAPFVLEMNLLRLTFGIGVKITVSSVIFIAVALLLGHTLTKGGR